jgi:hypothetical protein
MRVLLADPLATPYPGSRRWRAAVTFNVLLDPSRVGDARARRVLAAILCRDWMK